jgi:lipopolysaccharide transport system ATP-binding protein
MTRRWQIGIVGTFDVENYGDLLFPLLAEYELRARLGEVELHRFSYHARTSPTWPYDVQSVLDLPDVVSSLDGLLIGGGFLIRFDKIVADAYLPPSPLIHHPTGYWLTPALIALEQGVPVVWNAPGMHCNEIPLWSEPLLELALGESAYVAVRDEPTRAALERFAPGRIAVVPDTAFAIERLIGDANPSLPVKKPYIVVQPIRWADEGFPEFLEKNAHRFDDYELLALPVGPVLGDDAKFLGAARSRFVELERWPDPLTLARIIAGSSAAIGYSYHLAITAIASGVPVFTSVDLDTGKFTALRQHETVHPLRSIHDGDFFSRIGRAKRPASVDDSIARVEKHWDRVASAIERGRRGPSPAFGRFWQNLPSLLEPAAPRPTRFRRLLGKLRRSV